LRRRLGLAGSLHERVALFPRQHRVGLLPGVSGHPQQSILERNGLRDLMFLHDQVLDGRVRAAGAIIFPRKKFADGRFRYGWKPGCELPYDITPCRPIGGSIALSSPSIGSKFR
jgi:hypothetical protein